MTLDVIPLHKQLKSEAFTLHLGPTRWNSFTPTCCLSWDSVPWDTGQKSQVPSERGIYAFTVKFTNTSLPDHGYVLYVGITGDKGKGTLRTRFASYFREMHGGRDRVEAMLTQFEGNLRFQFATVGDRRVSLRKLEKQLCEAIIPFASRNDLSATVRKAKEAAGL